VASQFFQALKEEGPTVRPTVQEALSTLANAYQVRPGVPSGDIMNGHSRTGCDLETRVGAHVKFLAAWVLVMLAKPPAKRISIALVAGGRFTQHSPAAGGSTSRLPRPVTAEASSDGVGDL
jgi:hypothetical protein